MRHPHLSIWTCVFVALHIRNAVASPAAAARPQDDETTVNPTTSGSATGNLPSLSSNKPFINSGIPNSGSLSLLETYSVISVTAIGKADSSILPSSETLAKVTDATPSISSAINGPLQTSSGSVSSPDKQQSDALPLPPLITPGLAVAGVILILTGLTHTVIGIKNKWVQIFLSTALLTSLSVTVLLVYVMNPPVRPAVQGAYLVAAVMTGMIFGAGSLIFKEVTEGLGCLLGGFCLSMWLLALRSGGTLRSTGGKVIFIAVFTTFAFALSFSRYTRPHALIGATSFAGATAAVLGIDCFSRAGLKEFWVYIWDLNDKLFPIDTNTYPITRGIRVELAVIVLICLLGVISQLKLWKVVKDRQGKKVALRLGNKREQDQVEEAIGRRLEDGNERERAQWEAMYGDENDMRRNKQMDSGLGTEENCSLQKPSVSGPEDGGDGSECEAFEMGEVSSRNTEQQESPADKAGMNTPAIIEDVSQSPPEITKHMSPSPQPSLGWGHSATNTLLDSTAAPMTVAEGKTVPSCAPLLHIDPAPATNPPAEAPEGAVNTSMVNFDGPELNVPVGTKGLSGGPHMQQCLNSPEGTSICHSGADFVIPYAAHSRASSVAATCHDDDFDYDPVGNDQTASTSPMAESPQKVYVLPEVVIAPGSDSFQAEDGAQPRQIATPLPTPPALSAVDDSDPEEFHRPVQECPQPTAAESATSLNRENEGAVAATQRLSPGQSVPESPPEDDEAPRSNPKSGPRLSLDAVSGTGSLKKGVLDQVPHQLSQVVLSYRTNEWAKHISAADAPEFDEPEVAPEGVEEQAPMHFAEISMPVAAENAQKPLTIVTTPQAVLPQSTVSIPTAPLRDLHQTFSGEANVLTSQLPFDRASGDGAPQLDVLQDLSSQPRQGNGSAADLPRSASATSPLPPVATGVLRNGSSSVLGQKLMTSPIDENAEANFQPTSRSSASPLPIAGSTLLAQRDSFLRSKQYLLNTTNSAFPTEMVYSQPPTRPTSRLNLTEEVRSRAVSRLSNFEEEERNNPLRSASRLSLSPVDDEDMPLSQRKTLIQQQAVNLLPESRLAAGESFDAHLPHRSFPTTQKRESMLASWRQSIRQEEALSLVPKETVEGRRASMLMEKQQSRMNKQYQDVTKIYQENAVDQAMKRGDMQELHKRALRRMQADANRHVS